MHPLASRLVGGLVPAVPVPFRGAEIDEAAQQRYAAWMARRRVAGVAVWAHTGRGPHLSDEQRRLVLDVWREAMPDRVLVAGARDIGMAIAARRRHADALLAFPERHDPVAHHRRLSGELPVIAFHLYEAAGGVAYDDATLHAILDLPDVIGIKVATLDSVMTFQRIADIARSHPDKLLITGEDRFLGYSLMAGARSALIGMGAALTDMQAELVAAHEARDWAVFHDRSARADLLAAATFTAPMEGYIRRMLWAAAAEDAIPAEACDDPWGPELDPAERARVVQAVSDAGAARG
jgi:4-hydroxy-tetrahydrodipicolinate synthase